MERESSRVYSDDLSEQGQSSFVTDNQGAETQLAMSKSEGQLLEDVKAGEPMLTSASISQCGRPVLTSPNNDYPLVYQKAVDQLRRERSLRPSHVVDGGGDEFKRRLQAPNQWLIQPKFPEVELPTEVRKKELRRVCQKSSITSRFYSFMWNLKYMDPGQDDTRLLRSSGRSL
jgi:hypothetical protein